MGLVEVKAKIQAINEEMREILTKESKELFGAVPGLGAVTWTQYAPYFNDGEPCIFRVNDPTFTSLNSYEINRCGVDLSYGAEYTDVEDLTDFPPEIKSFWVYYCGTETVFVRGEDGSWEEFQGYERSWAPPKEIPAHIPQLSEEAKGRMKDFSSLICDRDFSSVMEAVFGSDGMVTLSENGYDVEDYDHD